MSRKELVRPGLIKAAVGGRITNRQVAAALGLGIRQVQRLQLDRDRQLALYQIGVQHAWPPS